MQKGEIQQVLVAVQQHLRGARSGTSDLCIFEFQVQVINPNSVGSIYSFVIFLTLRYSFIEFHPSEYTFLTLFLAKCKAARRNLTT